MHAAPMYIAETSPSPIRGRLISLKEFFIVLGMVVSARSFIHSYSFQLRKVEASLVGHLSSDHYQFYLS